MDDCVSNIGALQTGQDSVSGQMVKAQSVDTVSRQMSACAMRPDFKESLNDIRCPLLLIGGSDDSEFFINGVREISASVIGSEILILPNCGHLPTIESANNYYEDFKKNSC